jgi:hypothetical protein
VLTVCTDGKDPRGDEPYMSMAILRASGLWIHLVPLAIRNGAMREGVLAPVLGQRLALPLSGVSLSMLIFVSALVVAPWFHASSVADYVAAGVTWLLMRVLFEFLLGHYAMGKSLVQLLGVYDVVDGNLWKLVLISTAVSPYLGAKVRGLI